jgi:hypothetical protein
MHLRTDLVQGYSRKMAIDKLKINHKTQKIKLGQIHKLKTTKKATNSDLPGYRHKTKNQNTSISNS